MSTTEPPPPEKTLQEERDQRIAELEAKTRHRRFGVRWPTALLALVLAVGLFFWSGLHRDIAYFFSSPAPITLGSEGEYHFDRLTPNRYAQIHGIPTETGVFGRDGNQLYVMVGLKNTPVIVHRPALDSESDKPVTPVDQRPFGIRGRLMKAEQARALDRGIQEIAAKPAMVKRDGQVWLLKAEQRPRQDFSVIAWSAFLAAFVLLNLWFIARDLAARRGLR